MIVTDTLYRGQSDLITFILKDDAGLPLLFADMTEVVVQLKVNNVLQLTKTKTDEEVVAVAGETNRCKIAITDVESLDFPRGLLEIRLIMTLVDPDFPTGRKDIVQVRYKNVRD